MEPKETATKVWLSRCSGWRSLQPLARWFASDTPQACSNLWQEYVRLFQLTTEGLRDAISLECLWGARTQSSEGLCARCCSGWLVDVARTASSFTSLLGPCVPLAMLVVCVVPEVASHGTGACLSLRIYGCPPMVIMLCGLALGQV